jgi:hypothetical protein
MVIKVRKSNSGTKKVRVNITVDKESLERAKDKLEMFGGKLSTLFNAYLSDFVTSMDKRYNDNQKSLGKKVEEIEKKLKELEKRKD